MKKIREYWWLGLLLGISLFIVFFNTTTTISLLEERWCIELGDVVSLDPIDYFDLEYLTGEQIAYIEEHAIMNLESLDEVGEYQGEIIVEDEVYDLFFIVEDTTSPIIEIIQTFEIGIDTNIREDIVKEYIKVTDLQECTIEFISFVNSYQKEGQYSQNFIVTDHSNNSTTGEININVINNTTSTTQTITPTYVGDRVDVSDVVEVEREEFDYSWWMNLDDNEIKKTVLNSLVWKNEFTNQSIRGVQGLKFGFNIDDWAYGGLKLVENPYNVQFSGYQFVGGVELITRNTFSIYWSSNQDIQKFIDCGLLEIAIPNRVSQDVVYDYYA